MSNLRGVEDFGFQWSTDEQVYPFEKASDGSTLYCKEVDFGSLPNNGTKSVAHNLSGFTLHKFDGFNKDRVTGFYHLLTYNESGWEAVPRISPTDIIMKTNNDITDWDATFRLIYKK